MRISICEGRNFRRFQLKLSSDAFTSSNSLIYILSSDSSSTLNAYQHSLISRLGFDNQPGSGLDWKGRFVRRIVSSMVNLMYSTVLLDIVHPSS